MIASAGLGAGPFGALFHDGMDLATRVSAYLGGPGRDYVSDQPLDIRLAYHNEARELTTLLLQLAAWLLMERAVAEGEMTVDYAKEEAENLELRPRRALPAIGIPDALRALRAETELLRLRVVARAEHLLAMGERPPEDVAVGRSVPAQRPQLRLISDNDA